MNVLTYVHHDDTTEAVPDEGYGDIRARGRVCPDCVLICNSRGWEGVGAPIVWREELGGTRDSGVDLVD